jgi:hypothetical protein
MQMTPSVRGSQLRLWSALLCMLAVFVVSGVQVAHWDTQRLAKTATLQSAQTTDGLCPICYSVPVGHGAAPTTITPIQLDGTPTVATVARQSEGIQPEFHLHIRPPPAIA